MPYADIEVRRALQRKRHRRRVAERAALGLCTRCGGPTAPDGRRCEPCRAKTRAAERARYAAGKLAGKLYGGRNVEARRNDSRVRGRERHRARRAAETCTMCGRLPPIEGAAVCESCRSIRRARERERYARRKAGGRCVRCNDTVPAGASRCRRCATVEAERPKERKNAADRKRYARRRARRNCTRCGAWSGSAANCESCSRQARARSPQHRGVPASQPLFTVVEIATGLELARFESQAEAVAALAFPDFGPGEVEIASENTAALTAW